MPTTYPAELVRAVRLMLPDTEAIYGDAGDQYMFEDSDIEIFLTQGYGNAKWAAGLASLAIGGSEALIGKWIRNYETQTNGAALQREWNVKGKMLIAEGRAEIDSDDVGIFDVAYPQWSNGRHPEGYTHGSYRGPIPSSYQW